MFPRFKDPLRPRPTGMESYVYRVANITGLIGLNFGGNMAS